MKGMKAHPHNAKPNRLKLNPHPNRTIPLFLQKMNLVVDDDAFDQDIHQHIKKNAKCNVIVRKKQSKRLLAQHLHVVCMSTALFTFIKAIENNNFITWLGLTLELINKHLLKSLATMQGHLKSERQGLQLKKSSLFSKKEQCEVNDDHFPSLETPNIRSNEVCYAIVKTSQKTVHVDLTDRCPKTSSRCNQYNLAGDHYDVNRMLAEPTKNMKGETTNACWHALHIKFNKVGHDPETHILDKEVSKDSLDSFDHEKMQHQLVTPCKYRNNQAGCDIQTFKSHFKSGIATVNPNFPFSE